MISYKDQNVRRELIMKHYSSPINKKKLESSDADLFSDHCVDEIHIKLDIEKDIIKDAKFDGEGCAVFLSASDIMLEVIKGLTTEDAKLLIEEYDQMIRGKKDFNDEMLGELAIYENVGSHLNRLHCAEMVSNALRKIL